MVFVMLRCLALIVSILIVCCRPDANETVKKVKSIQLVEDEGSKDSEFLNIYQVKRTESNGFLQENTRIVIEHYGENIRSYQEIYAIFDSAERVVITEEPAYFITCNRQGSAWGARQSIIVWANQSNWRITPLHFDRATLRRDPKRFLIEERMGDKDEEKSPVELFEFKNGLLYERKT